ncbi:Creatinase/aminopeptidase [Neoconidiobolus thromboides FSU 785]|nr:Creatinase/aminopeptidase [Neoconidiobolus thromboides FSU 785]
MKLNYKPLLHLANKTKWHNLINKTIVNDNKIINKSYYSSFSNHLGQPSFKTHPHLLQKDQILVGITKDELELRRLKLLEKIPEGSVVLVFGHRLKFRSNNIFYPFHQNPNLLYLCGFDQPNSILVLIKDSNLQRKYKMGLFIEPKSADIELWEGPKCGLDEGKNYFGADETIDIKEFTNLIKPILNKAKTIYIDLQKPIELNSTEYNITNYLNQQKLNFKVKNLKANIEEMRLYKSEAEVKLIKKAAEITKRGFAKVLKNIVMELTSNFNDGINEHDIASTFENEIRRMGSQGHAYVPVVANGTNALSLHYVSNNMALKKGKLLMMDAGAAYFGYNSDVTRTWPVGKRFTKDQAELYQAVLNVQKKCIERCNTQLYNDSLNDILFKSIDWLKDELNLLGFNVSRNEVHDKLYPHHIGHYLGLDIHDTPSSTRTQYLKPGMLVTIEPGVYVPIDDKYPKRFQGIGIRIEDNILIEKNGNYLNLTQNIPKEIEELEAFLNKP